MLLGTVAADGVESSENPHIRIPRFKYFHSKAECIKLFFKDVEVPAD